MKKIMVELWFEDDFVPPDYFEEPCWANNWTSKCQECPLFSWNDDADGSSSGDCHFCGQWDEDEVGTKCPLKKYFIEEAKQ